VEQERPEGTTRRTTAVSGVPVGATDLFSDSLFSQLLLFSGLKLPAVVVV
jgi:hypothetical protein